jgi:hypothetical protein
MHEVLAETQAGKLIFPEVVRRSRDFLHVRWQDPSRKFFLPLLPVAEEFSSPDLIAAIRGALADEIRYLEFMKRAAAAGVIAYWAFLIGKKVVYFGRKGESHVEDFPRTKS